jgi:Tol biopolymer transport system component
MAVGKRRQTQGSATGVTWRRTRDLLVVCCAFALIGTPAASAGTEHTRRVSVGTTGTQGDGNSESPSISSNGRYVAFESSSDNLVANDTNGMRDIFVRDRLLGTTELISTSTGGLQGDLESYHSSISADGRFVAFWSNATNLVAGDTNAAADVFVRDRELGRTRRVSMSSEGVQGDSYSFMPSISADGRFVVFGSAASNLVASDTNGIEDAFVRDLRRHRTVRVSVSSSGAQTDAQSSTMEPVLSAMGRYVAFASDATTLASNDSNGATDVFVRDRRLHRTRMMSVGRAGLAADGDSYSPAISADGRFVTFTSLATNLVTGDHNHSSDVFVRDQQSRTTRLESVASDGTHANGGSTLPAISGDGRFVVFTSGGDNLVSGDTNGWLDVFERDRVLDRTKRVSISTSGTQGDNYSYRPAISGDGEYIAFESYASNMVAGDTNNVADVFVRGPAT